MSIKNIRRYGTASTPFQLALKSPQVYLKACTKVNPAWGRRLESLDIKSATVAGALWAGAVAIGNGCRISEVLRIKVANLQSNGLAWTEGSKGSNARLIYLGLDLETVKELLQLPEPVAVFPCTYSKVWAAVCSFGFASQLPAHEHRTVTHSGRYTLAQTVASKASSEVAGQVLGHKSKTAVEFYTHPENCKRKVTRKKPSFTCQNLEDLLNSLE